MLMQNEIRAFMHSVVLFINITMIFSKQMIQTFHFQKKFAWVHKHFKMIRIITTPENLYSSLAFWVLPK